MNMNLEETVLLRLERNKGSFISGAALAQELGLSRNAVWKSIERLRQSGYAIESITGKGYRLDMRSSTLSKASIVRHLHDPAFHVEYHERIDSTNTRCKELAEGGAPEGTLVVADCQTAGKGRQGRPFLSPPRSGVYFSILLRPKFTLQGVTLITSYSAVCLAETLEEICKKPIQIKWVNDIFCAGHKVSGILTEASFDAESANVSYLVVGIGVNVFDPPDDFYNTIGQRIHSICGSQVDESDIRARIVAETARSLLYGYAAAPSCSHLEAYRERSMLDGKTVSVDSAGMHGTAQVLGVNSDFTLGVIFEDGTRRDLIYGEVHIPSDQF